jgi:hypothetical protein
MLFYLGINTLVNDLEQSLDSVTSALSSLSPPNSTSIVPSQLFVTSKSVAQQVAIGINSFCHANVYDFEEKIPFKQGRETTAHIHV